MIKHIERIAKYNKERGFFDKGFDADLENSFLLSEELETLIHTDLSRDLNLGISQCRQLGYDAGMTKDQFEAMQQFEKKIPVEVIKRTGSKINPSLKMHIQIEG